MAHLSNEQPNNALLIARFIAAGFIVVVAAMTVAAFSIATGADPTDPAAFDAAEARLVRSVMLALGAVFPFLSIVVRRIMDARAIASGAPFQRRLQNMLIALSLCEIPAILGFVAAALLHDVRAVLLLGLFSVTACAMHFPRRRMFEPEHR